jgi:hypothetical protein
MPRSYQRREPEKSVLYRLVQNNLATFIARAEQRGRTIPWFVRKELEGYLDCGILARGFVRVACKSCAFERLVALSCKGRGFCSSCQGRRMTATAAHVVDNVFPLNVPVRQWVVSLPMQLRYLLAYDADLCGRAVTLFVREVFRWYRWCAKVELDLDSVSEAKTGSLTVVQRFDSALRLNVHFHTLVLDGVYVRDPDTGRLVFHALPQPSTEDVQRIAGWVRDKIWQLVEDRGLAYRRPEVDEPQQDLLAEREPLLAECSGAAVTGRVASGRRAGRGVIRLRDELLARALEADLPDRCANVDGFSLHANVSIRASDRRRLERLVRYISRPPISTDRLEELADGRVQYQLRRPWSDGTVAIVYEPLELMERLVALVWPPGFHRTRYHGVLARAAPERHHVVPAAAPNRNRRKKPKNYCWAELMKRAFEFDVLVCPKCSGPMKVTATIMEREVIDAILKAVGYPADSPTPAPAEPPPEEVFLESA